MLNIMKTTFLLLLLVFLSCNHKKKAPSSREIATNVVKEKREILINLKGKINQNKIPISSDLFKSTICLMIEKEDEFIKKMLSKKAGLYFLNAKIEYDLASEIEQLIQIFIPVKEGSKNKHRNMILILTYIELNKEKFKCNDKSFVRDVFTHNFFKKLSSFKHINKIYKRNGNYITFLDFFDLLTKNKKLHKTFLKLYPEIRNTLVNLLDAKKYSELNQTDS